MSPPGVPSSSRSPRNIQHHLFQGEEKDENLENSNIPKYIRILSILQEFFKFNLSLSLSLFVRAPALEKESEEKLSHPDESISRKMYQRDTWGGEGKEKKRGKGGRGRKIGNIEGVGRGRCRGKLPIILRCNNGSPAGVTAK